MLHTRDAENKKSRAFVVMTSLALFGFLSAALLSPGANWSQQDELRAPAQAYAGAGPMHARSKKGVVLHSQPLSHGKRFGKASGPLRLEITATQINPWVQRLEARVTTNTRFTQLEYLWTLPEDVRILQGSIEGILGEVDPGDKTVLALEIETLTENSEPLPVFFHAFEWRQGERYGYSDQILMEPHRSDRTLEESGMLKAQGVAAPKEETGYRIDPDRRIQF